MYVPESAKIGVKVIEPVTGTISDSVGLNRPGFCGGHLV